MNTQLATAAASEVVEVMVKALHRAEEPLTASKLRQGLTGPYKLPDKQILVLLDDLVVQGRVHRFDPSKRGGKPRYWTRDNDQYARQVMLSRLSRHPLTWSELRKALSSTLKGVPEDRLDRISQELQGDGQIRKLPRLLGARADRFSTQGPDPRVYIQDALQKIYRALEKSGVTRQQVNEAALSLLASAHPTRADDLGRAEIPAPSAPAPSDEELGRRILERMVLVVPAAANGALVSLRDLWRSMQFQLPEKSAFDQAVLRLAEGGRVALHRHDYPAGLSDEEKAEMIPDGRGGHYIGVAQRV